jgi:hypothetical protein
VQYRFVMAQVKRRGKRKQRKRHIGDSQAGLYQRNSPAWRARGYAHRAGLSQQFFDRFSFHCLWQSQIESQRFIA